MEGSRLEAAVVVLDTNVFVAAGFKPRSASAGIIERVRDGRIRMVWHEQTRRETEHVLNKIPPISWNDVAGLFREEDRYQGKLAVDEYSHVPDYEDRKYAALASVTGAILLTNDSHLLSTREKTKVVIITPGEYWDRLADNLP